METRPILLRSILIFVLAGLLIGLQAGSAQAISDIVISQIYGGGGNSGATYKNDFIELFYRGTTSISITGWSVQYASATGTGLFSNAMTPLSGTLVPGQYYLIQEAAGSGGTVSLPTPDATGTIAMSATGAKVALVDTTTGLACNGGSTPCSPAQLAEIMDLVGWGDANFFEGSGPGPTTSNTTSLLRINGGLQDTDNNSIDFGVGVPTPRNTASPLNPPIPTAVPEPMTMLLLGSGLIGLAGYGRRKFFKK